MEKGGNTMKGLEIIILKISPKAAIHHNGKRTYELPTKDHEQDLIFRLYRVAQEQKEPATMYTRRDEYGRRRWYIEFQDEAKK
jgi:hypothetical protein